MLYYTIILCGAVRYRGCLLNFWKIFQSFFLSFFAESFSNLSPSKIMIVDLQTCFIIFAGCSAWCSAIIVLFFFYFRTGRSVSWKSDSHRPLQTAEKGRQLVADWSKKRRVQLDITQLVWKHRAGKFEKKAVCYGMAMMKMWHDVSWRLSGAW